MLLVKMELNCNFRCKYCYQKPIRKLAQSKWDLDAVLNTIRGRKGTARQVVLHGGEPTLIPIDVMDKILSVAKDAGCTVSMQTNAYALTRQHAELFKKYNASIGVSCDGPEECGMLRGVGSKSDRIKQANRVMENLNMLLDAGVKPSVISVIHRVNGIKYLDKFKQFFIDINNKGITGRLNPCCSGTKYDLTVEEAKRFYMGMYDLVLEHGISGWSPFSDIVNSLRGAGNVVCVFQNCDPLCTTSATSIFNDGSCGVCLRLYNDGKIYLRSDKQSDIRSRILAETECKGCEWFGNCYGGCSGLAIDFDWRHKDRYVRYGRHCLLGLARCSRVWVFKCPHVKVKVDIVILE